MSSSVKVVLPVGGAASGQQASAMPKHFKLKKHLLLITLAAYTIDNFLYLVELDQITQTALSVASKNGINQVVEDADALKPLIRQFIVGFIVLCIAFNLLFIVGIARQNICLSTVYTALTLVYAVAAGLGFVLNANGILRIVEAVLVATLAVMFLLDLRQIQDVNCRVGNCV